jgi:myo-inositol 2-dehydrogenase / D-chiro-inositol 1-dehydrogenase
MDRHRSSRRDFLKTSALGAGLAAAGTVNLARSAHAAGSDVLKIALIGCGGRGTGAAANCLNAAKLLNDKVRLVAVADAFEDRARGSLAMLKKEFPEAVDVSPDHVFVGLDAFQKATDCGVDMVLLGTPPGFRPPHHAYAIQKGKHVFMEKPCCTDAPGFRTLVESNKLADEKKLKVVVGLQRHHQAGYLQGIKEIHDGKLGDLRFLRVYWNGSGGGAHDIGKRMPGAKDEMTFQIRNWGCFVWLYGDNIVEQHVHNLDIGNWVMCKDGDPRKAHPVEANGMGGRVNPGNYGDIFDHHFVEYTYADGTKMFSQSRHIQGTWDHVAEFAHGTKGNRGVATGGGPKLESGNPYDQEHVDLIKAIRKDEPLNEGWFGAFSSMTAVLGRMATYSGQIVRWDDAVAKGPDESPERLAWDALPRHLPGEDGRYPFPMPGVYKAY